MATLALVLFLIVDAGAVLYALHRLHTYRVESDRTDARFRIRYR